MFSIKIKYYFYFLINKHSLENKYFDIIFYIQNIQFWLVFKLVKKNCLIDN